MRVEAGELLRGRITGIAKYGVFVDLGEGVSGMVHISEIADTFVKEITDHVSLGQQVDVKVISIDERGKIALSIKQAAGTGGSGTGGSGGGTSGGTGGSSGGTSSSGSTGGRNGSTGYAHNPNGSRGRRADREEEDAFDGYPQEGAVRKSTGNKNFDDMLNRFMQSSNEKIGGMRRNGDHRPRRGGRR